MERRSVYHNDHNYCKDSSIDGNEKVSASVCEAVSSSDCDKYQMSNEVFTLLCVMFLLCVFDAGYG